MNATLEGTGYSFRRNIEAETIEEAILAGKGIGIYKVVIDNFNLEGTPHL